jgi:hypothetical protein
MIGHEHERILVQGWKSRGQGAPNGLYATAEVVEDAALVRDNTEDGLVLRDLRRDEEPAFGVVDVRIAGCGHGG